MVIFHALHAFIVRFKMSARCHAGEDSSSLTTDCLLGQLNGELHAISPWGDILGEDTLPSEPPES